tara:strand:- start:16706 stop:16939 length:234 start_codon:yes stop_codon:yes gene_type:complete
MMFDNGINNEFEEAHQKGLHRGFDLGWSYKGRYYRQMVRDMLNDKDFLKSGEATLKKLLNKMERDEDNKENVTINSW